MKTKKQKILLFCIVLLALNACERKIPPRIALFSFELNGEVYNADIYNKHAVVIVNEHWKSQNDFVDYYIFYNNPESSVSTFCFALQDSTYGINPIFYIEDGYDVEFFNMAIDKIDPDKTYRAVKGYITFNQSGEFKEVRPMYNETVVSGEFDIYMVDKENDTDTIHVTNGKYAFNAVDYALNKPK